MIKKLTILLLFAIATNYTLSQTTLGGGNKINYLNPKKYNIASVKIDGPGAQFIDQNALLLIADIKPGDQITIPGDRISKAIKNLWQ